MKNWREVNQKLQAVLSKEIDLRRELLGNMNQQEYGILTGDGQAKGDLYLLCRHLIARLRGITKERGILTRKLHHHLSPSSYQERLRDILDPYSEIDSETLHLYNYAKELIKKIRLQHQRNKSLDAALRREGSFEVCPTGVRTGHGKGKQITLITIDYPEDKKPF